MTVEELQPYWLKRVRVVSKSGAVIIGLFDGYTPDEYDERTDTEKPSIDFTLPDGSYCFTFVENIVSIELV